MSTAGQVVNQCMTFSWFFFVSLLFCPLKNKWENTEKFIFSDFRNSHNNTNGDNEKKGDTKIIKLNSLPTSHCKLLRTVRPLKMSIGVTELLCESNVSIKYFKVGLLEYIIFRVYYIFLC